MEKRLSGTAMAVSLFAVQIGLMILVNEDLNVLVVVDRQLRMN
jgi:hypothetical protein